jgi:hypothetical protein
LPLAGNGQLFESNDRRCYNSVPLAASAEVRENAKLTTLRDTARKQVKTITSVIPSLIR